MEHGEQSKTFAKYAKVLKSVSIHWIAFCQFPWSSMTIKSSGEGVECVEDYNNEIILADARTTSLYKTWSGDLVQQFRMHHFDLTPGLKCTERCDMMLVGRVFVRKRMK